MDAELIDLPLLAVRRIAVSGMDNNVYLLTSRADGEALLIDAAAEPEAIEELLAGAAGDAEAPTALRYVLTTHSHHDHIGALAAVVAAHPEVETLAGDADAADITRGTGVAIDRMLMHGDLVTLGGLRLEVIGLRGHTPGSVAVAYSEPPQPARLFTGDSLFPGGVGNTDGDRRRFNSLLADVVSRIFEVYPDDTVVHPGHGQPTTIAAERSQLPEWLARGW